ncbi:testis-expressed protein 9-like [Symsagittifera roscoffensis]|uniref:testis-expressed protein 9-like n=1 Tax=Symsagittifera roscoffensis TaxID=84072 RepID=UPI00307BDBB6
MSRGSSAISSNASTKRNTYSTLAGGDYLSKEDEYSRLNAELEARTASLLKDAESVLKHNEKLLGEDGDTSEEVHMRSRGIGFSFGDVRYEEESYETSHDTKYDSSNAYAEDTNEDPKSLEMSHEDYGMSLEEQLRSGGGMGGTQGMPGSSAGTASGRNSRAMTAMGSNGNVLQNKGRQGAKSASAVSKPITPKRPVSGVARTNKTQNVKSKADFVATPSQVAAATLQSTIARIEKESDNTAGEADNTNEADDLGVASELGSAAVNRFLKAKLRVLQEELDRMSRELNKKEQENLKMQHKLKEAEEERGKLQKSTNNQQSQVDKFKRTVDEWRRKSESAESQLILLKKELEAVKREANKAGGGAGGKSVTEVRLNRALEEVEKYKTQLAKVNQNSKETSDTERKRMEQLINENKKLEKQKSELIAGFKKQLKLIDLLKRQRMHIEAAKLLHFTEEEFMKALDLGS